MVHYIQHVHYPPPCSAFAPVPLPNLSNITQQKLPRTTHYRHKMPFILDLNHELRLLRLNLTRPLNRRTDSLSTAEDRAIFGCGGMIMPILKRLAQREDNCGIQFLIEIVLQQALAVATIWDESRTSGTRSSPSMLEYPWYTLGLMEVRSIFLFNCYQALDGPSSEQWLRERVIDLPFVDLWNALWKVARTLDSVRGKHPAKHCRLMYRYVLANFLFIDDVQLELLDRIRETVFGKFEDEYDGEIRTLGTVDVGVLMEKFDFGFIPGADFLEYWPYIRLNWGMYLYPEETRVLERVLRSEEDDESDFDDDEDEDEDWDSDDDDNDIPPEFHLNAYDTSHLEAYGPTIDPELIGTHATHVPEGRNCTICVEEFGGDDEANLVNGQQCVQLWGCGHHFHHVCIRTWMNGVAANSNLCPECRGMMFEVRRPVRAIVVQENPRLIEMPVVFEEE